MFFIVSRLSFESKSVLGENVTTKKSVLLYLSLTSLKNFKSLSSSSSNVSAEASISSFVA